MKLVEVESNHSISWRSFRRLCQTTVSVGGSCFRSTLNRFASADTIVPDPTNPQSFNRYSYVRNNPVKLLDPSGHAECGSPWEPACAGDSSPATPTPPPSMPLVVDIADEYVDWYYSPNYGGCFRCHATFGTNQTVLTNEQLAESHHNMEVAAFQGTVAAGTGIVIGTGSYYIFCANDGDCTNELQGVWNLHPFERGWKIENAIGRSEELVPNFPVIDRFNNGVATSIKSIDLGAKSYQNINTLTRTIAGYVDKLANWQGASWGGVTIRSSDIVSRELLLAIPQGANPSQLEALLQLQQWAASQGVTLTTIPIP